MSEGFFDRNLRKLLGAARTPAGPSSEFRESLQRSLHAEAARMRRASAPQVLPGAQPRAWRPWAVAAAAMVIATIGGLGLNEFFDWSGSRRRVAGVVESGEHVASARFSPDGPIVLEVPRGATGSASLTRGPEEIARLDLADGAELEVRPGRVALLALHDGVARVEAVEDLRLTAAHVQMVVPSGADVHVAIIREGDRSMYKSWLIPGGVGAAAGAALVAVLVHKGEVEVKVPDSRPTVAPVEKPLVMQVPATRPVRDDDRDQRLAQAERKVADLEKKLAAAKKESEALASELVQKKGVTIESIAAQLAELRKGGGKGVFLPGKTSSLIADLRGLGPAGTQALLDLLKSEDAADRFIAAKLLEELKDPAAIPSLREAALNDTDDMAAKMAGHALALMEDPRAIEPLREILSKKRSWESEVNALWGLVNLGDRDGLEQAVAYMDDKKVSDQARGALGANIAMFMHSPEVMPIVDATVRDFYESATVMGIAVDYYRQVGTPVARDRLQAIANDTRVSEAIRQQARDALN